jgi:hypothetical protein
LGPLSIDEFRVKVTKFPVIDGNQVNASELFDYVRTHFRQFPGGFWSKFSPYSPGIDDIKWVSRSPAGTVFHIDVMLPDDASVVASLVEAKRCIFTTITTGRSGIHPVSGNREFGYREESGTTIFIQRERIDLQKVWKPSPPVLPIGEPNGCG